MVRGPGPLLPCFSPACHIHILSQPTPRTQRKRCGQNLGERPADAQRSAPLHHQQEGPYPTTKLPL
jgi:hypothetical protein